MSKCDNCRLRKETSQAFDIHWHGEEDCPYDVCPEIKTNGDRIRAMSDEELAGWIWADACPGFPTTSFGSCPEGQEKSCRECWLEWLKKEAKDG